MSFFASMMEDSLFHYMYVVRTAAAAEIFLCIFFYTLSYRKRRAWLLRLLAGAAGFPLLLIPLVYLGTRHPGSVTNILATLFTYGYCLALLWACYEEQLSELLLCLCSGLATQVIVGKLFECLYILMGKDPYNSLSLFPEGTLPAQLDWAVYFLLHLALILCCSLLFRRKRVYTHNGFYTRLIVNFSLIITVVTVALTSYSRPIEPENHELAMVIRIFSILYALLVLILRTGILEQSRMTEELRTTEELLYAEKKQFENIRSDMEIINMKCHDIRHQLSQYAGKLTDQELEELKSAIHIYDASLKTGNDILDMLLYKKRLVCEQDHIQISCIADGACLSFLPSSHLYSLLNNALENAIEAVGQLEDPEMRVISLQIGLENGLAAIHMTNYFKDCRIEDGLPQTTHTEDAQHHGYGTKSMRYIVQKYDGTISFEAVENIFYLDILLPVPETGQGPVLSI